MSEETGDDSDGFFRQTFEAGGQQEVINWICPDTSEIKLLNQEVYFAAKIY